MNSVFSRPTSLYFTPTVTVDRTPTQLFSSILTFVIFAVAFVLFPSHRLCLSYKNAIVGDQNHIE